MTEQHQSDISELSFEQARDSLSEIVNKLEQGGTSLEESLQLWQRGNALAKHCEQFLQRARQTLAKAQQETDSEAEGE